MDTLREEFVVAVSKNSGIWFHWCNC